MGHGLGQRFAVKNIHIDMVTVLRKEPVQQPGQIAYPLRRRAPRALGTMVKV